MGAKRDEFEESTKVRSAAEIDEMLRSASASAEVPEANEDFEADQHTKVGNIDALVAQTRARTGDLVPRTPNIVRRDSQPVLPAVGRNTPTFGTRAAGSQSEIVKEAKSDDAAFDEMLDEPKRDSQRTFGEKAQPMPLPAPAQSARMPVATKLPAAPQKGVRWGVIAWFALLAIMIGVGSVGYIRIKQLEEQLAAAKTKLEQPAPR